MVVMESEQVIDSLRPIAAVLLPAIVAVFVYQLDSSRARDGLALAGVVATGALLASMVPSTLEGQIYGFDGAELVPNIPLVLAADTAGILVAGMAVGVTFVGVVYTSYVDDRSLGRPTRTIACLLACLSAVITAGFAGNLLVLFIALELLTLVTYPIVSTREDRLARRAGYTYLAYGLTGGLSILIGMRLIYVQVETVTFVDEGIPELVSVAVTDPWILRVAFGLLLVGFAFKAALIPVHSWLISARVAPSPIFGLIFAIIVIKAGVFGLIRVVHEVFGPATVEALGVGPIALVAGAVTVVIAGLMAYTMEHARDRFTYLAILGGGTGVLGLSVVDPAIRWWVLAYLLLHAVGLLVGFVGIAVYTASVERADRFGQVLTGVAAIWLIVLSVLAAGASISASSGTEGPVITAVLVVGVIAHVLALWPAIFGIVQRAPDIMQYPTSSGWMILDEPAWWCRSAMTTVRVSGVSVATGAMLVVREPASAIESALPEQLVPRYRTYRVRSLGVTGTKLSVEGSIYVLVAVLVIGLVLGLR